MFEGARSQFVVANFIFVRHRWATRVCHTVHQKTSQHHEPSSQTRSWTVVCFKLDRLFV